MAAKKKIKKAKSGRVPAETNPWYWIAKEGTETWNRWARKDMPDAQAEIYGIKDIKPLNPKETEQLLEKVNKGLQSAKMPPRTRLPFPQEHVDFKNTIWSEKWWPDYPDNKDVANFYNYVFPSEVDFENALFEGGASFYEAHFAERASFGLNSTIAGSNNTKFRSAVNFNKANFHGTALFVYAEFNHDAGFFNTIFHMNASFYGAKFTKGVPFFNGIKLNGSFNLNNIDWGSIPIPEWDKQHDPDKKIFDRKISSELMTWVQLKGEMHRLHMYEEELLLFSKELDLKAQLGRTSWAARWVIHRYKQWSQYGQSIRLPIIWMARLWLVFFLVYYVQLFMPMPLLDVSWEGLRRAAYFANAHTLPFIPVDNMLYGEILKQSPVAQQYPSIREFWFPLVRTLHIILAGILLFLTGLGIRNRLRIK